MKPPSDILLVAVASSVTMVTFSSALFFLSFSHYDNKSKKVTKAKCSLHKFTNSQIYTDQRSRSEHSFCFYRNTTGLPGNKGAIKEISTTALNPV